MEGATWIVKKANDENDKHIKKIHNIIGEFQKKSQACIIDPRINEVDGKKMLIVQDWLQQAIDKEIAEVGEKFDSMFENVNYHMKEAVK